MRSRLPGLVATVVVVALVPLTSPAQASTTVAAWARAGAVGALAEPTSPHGPSRSEAARILRADETAAVTDEGRLYFRDPPTTAQGRAVAGAAALTPPAGPPTAAQAARIPALHSLPGSTHTIFLDFDGTLLPAVSDWADGTIVPGTYAGFSLDADPAFSDAEVAQIRSMWRFVAEKYSPWDVDVTTVDPGTPGVDRTAAADIRFGTHVVITSDPRPANTACGGDCSGIAFDGTFGEVGDTGADPAWVFASQTYGNAVITAHSAAHEVGHTLGLGHDGDQAGDYYAGNGKLWVPIMGLSDQNAVAQFSRGEYAGANQTEDDLAIIGARGDSGLSGSLLRRDDHPNSGGVPEQLGDHASYTVDGVISSAADTDLFAVPHPCSDPLTATVSGIGIGQSLDAEVQILNGLGTVLTSADPAASAVYDQTAQTYRADGLDARATLGAPTAGAGYRILVRGVGAGDPATTGYSSYASLGQYRLSVSGCPASAPPPLVVIPLPLPLPVPTPAPVATPRVTAPSAPRSPRATAGAAGGARTARISWTVPARDGRTRITGYRAYASKVVLGLVRVTRASRLLPATARSFVWKLPAAKYKFRVVALNRAGASPPSLFSKIVAAR